MNFERPKHRSTGTAPVWRPIRGAMIAVMVITAIWAGIAAAAGPSSMRIGGAVRGSATLAGAGENGPLSAGAEYELRGAGVARPASLGRVTFMAGLRVAVGPDPVTGVVRVALTEALVNAAGDQLIVLHVVDARRGRDGVLRGSGGWSVIGGTGAFSATTGSGTGDLVLDLRRGRFSSSLGGTISAG